MHDCDTCTPVFTNIIHIRCVRDVCLRGRIPSWSIWWANRAEPQCGRMIIFRVNRKHPRVQSSECTSLRPHECAAQHLSRIVMHMQLFRNARKERTPHMRHNYTHTHTLTYAHDVLYIGACVLFPTNASKSKKQLETHTISRDSSTTSMETNNWIQYTAQGAQQRRPIYAEPGMHTCARHSAAAAADARVSYYE